MSTIASSKVGTMVPLYSYPTSTVWNTLIQTKLDHPNVPICAIINPNSGPGAAIDSAYTSGITRLKNAGIIVLGYMANGFGSQTQSAAQSVVNTWHTFYPTVDGIFVDEMSNQSTMQSYYSTLDAYIKSIGFTTSTGNPGTTVPTSFIGNTFDTVILYENAQLPTSSTIASLGNTYSQYVNNKLGFLAYAVSSYDSVTVNSLAATFGWIYFTDDTLQNPWDLLASYFGTLVTQLDTISSGGGSSMQQFDQWGIQRIYDTKTGGNEWFVNMADPTSDPLLQNEPALSRQADGSWEMSGTPRLEAWSPAYSDTTARLNARWLNVEITSYFKVISVLSTSEGSAFQHYSRGGHHFASGDFPSGMNRHCEGSALKFRVMHNGEARCRKEVNHPAYAGDRAAKDSGSGNVIGHWIGFKTVMWNVVDPNGKTYTMQEIWMDTSPEDAQGNLVINNNENRWRRITSNKDTGGWSVAGDPDFLTSCPVLNKDSTFSTRQADEILNTPGGSVDSTSANFNRNLCAWRSDDQTVRWKYLSAREIDITRPIFPAAGGTGGVTPSPSPTPTPTPTPTPSANNDMFGVAKIYPTKLNADEWFMDMNNPVVNTNRFFISVQPVKNSDGSWKIRTLNARMQLYNRNGFNAGITSANAINHTALFNTGYMQDVADWRNVEITGYVRLNASSTQPAGGPHPFIWYCRGGRQTSPEPNCEGSSLKGFLYNNGDTQLVKEQWYNGAYFYRPVDHDVTATSLVGKWVGFKLICYNQRFGDIIYTKQEIWVDWNATNNFVKVSETTDTGGWGDKDAACFGAIDQIITWGGPIIGFRWDFFDDVDIKWFSAREINENATLLSPPPPPPPSHCGSIIPGGITVTDTTSPLDVNLYDDFNSGNYMLSQGATSPNSKWMNISLGAGESGVSLEPSTGRTTFYAITRQSNDPAIDPTAALSYSSLTLSTASWSDFTLDMDIKTVTQRSLRTRNTREVAWLQWRYADSFHWYYLIFKSDGVEFGKRDNTTQSATNVILFSSATPTMVYNNWHHVKIEQVAARANIWIDNVLVVNAVVDGNYNLTTMAQGFLGLFTLDASTRFDNVVMKPKQYTTYTVQSGDSLSSIGDATGVPWQEIALVNTILPPNYTIFLGQVLKIPVAGS